MIETEHRVPARRSYSLQKSESFTIHTGWWRAFRVCYPTSLVRLASPVPRKQRQRRSASVAGDVGELRRTLVNRLRLEAERAYEPSRPLHGSLN